MIIIVFIGVYSLFLIALVGIGCQIQWRKEKQLLKARKNGVSLDDTVVIIPFRNEKERIFGLIESINQSGAHPKEYVFVDDHSQDGTSDVIRENIEVTNCRILHLPASLEGKKHAIRFGISHSRSTYILGFDADITFSKDYFQQLSTLASADMYILPAILLPKRWWQRFFELDLVLVNAINCGITGWYRPLIASGANLLYRRDAFEAYDRLDSHVHTPSGDDIYLLRDFRSAGANVQLISQPSLAVYSETPQSLKEFLHQRLRWIAKTGDVGDHVSTGLSLVQFFLTLVFVVLLLWFVFIGNAISSLVLASVKFGLDMALFFPFFRRQKRISSWGLLPLYEFIFPIYSLVIAASMYVIKPIWKGRRLNTNY